MITLQTECTVTPFTSASLKSRKIPIIRVPSFSDEHPIVCRADAVLFAQDNGAIHHA